MAAVSLTRHLFLDVAPGETRGVVLVNGRPERLLISRDGDPTPRLGARYLGRVVASSSRMGLARIDIGLGGEPGPAASLKLSGADAPSDGATVEVEVTAEPARGKGANVSLIRIAPTGRPGMTAPPPSVRDRLLTLEPDTPIVEGDRARDVADDAQTEALAREHVHSGGLTLTIESTRALVAVDVDVGERAGSDAKRVTRAANFAALTLAARVLRLKGEGGLVVIDLAGRGHDGPAMISGARLAFGPDNPGVAFGPISRFGTLELTVPRRRRSLAERLLGPDGQPTALTLALRLIRQIEREAQADPGAQLEIRAAPDVAEAAAPYLSALTDRFGGRLALVADAARARGDNDIKAR